MKKVVYSPDAIEKIQKIERQVRAEYGNNTACIWRSKKERRPPRMGELCRRRREYKPPEMGIPDALAGG